MRKVSILLLAMIYVSVVFGQQQKVAVYVTGGQDVGINKVLGDQLVAAIVKSGRYIAIERTSSFLAELGKEQSYQRTGAVDDNELSRLGKQFGVQLVCVADVSDVFGQKYVSARLINVESAEVVVTSNKSSSLNSMDELLKITDSIAKELTGKTAKEQAAETAKIDAEKEAKVIEARAASEKEEKERAQGYVIIGNLAIQVAVSGAVDWNTANAIAKSSTTAGFTNWRLPTMGELGLIYANRNKINFSHLVFDNDFTHSYQGAWSNDLCKGGYQFMAGSGGNIFCSADKIMVRKGGSKSILKIIAISVRDIK
ncbi:MAG: DUF1566 domain-containing protein [Bacteroidales bacterium]|jgi:hypothetical protein|nr:DUF1566 domain-containing protein [Bacteroidales bacterium]